MKSDAEGVSRQLRAWADARQNSPIKGQRYLDEKSRRAAQARRERQEFVERLRQAQEENIRKTGESESRILKAEG